MIKTETRGLHGLEYKYTYSDAGYKIRQDGTGNIYDEAYDPLDTTRTYTETDIPIEQDEEVEDIVEELQSRW